MGRKKKPLPAELARRLTAVKIMVDNLEDAMPTAAREMRRQACEELDDVIAELRAA